MLRRPYCHREGSRWGGRLASQLQSRRGRPSAGFPQSGHRM